MFFGMQDFDFPKFAQILGNYPKYFVPNLPKFYLIFAQKFARGYGRISSSYCTDHNCLNTP